MASGARADQGEARIASRLDELSLGAALHKQFRAHQPNYLALSVIQWDRPSAATTKVPFDLAPLSTSPVPGHANSGFGWRDDPIRHRPRFHAGADFRAPSGTPVLAAGSGTVVFAGRSGGYGRMVVVDHGGGVTTRYAHLQRISAETGQRLQAGIQLGTVGSTGRSTGPHLHFEVRLDGSPIDPNTALEFADLARREDARLVARWAELETTKQRAKRSAIDPPRTRRAAPGRPDRVGRIRTKRPNV